MGLSGPFFIDVIRSWPYTRNTVLSLLVCYTLGIHPLRYLSLLLPNTGFILIGLFSQ